jgi:8-amino-7-oxononanoate synthase
VKGFKKASTQKRRHSTQTESFRHELKHLKDKSLLRSLTCIDSPQGPRIAIGGKTYLNFSSNDYLNLSGHREVVKAAIIALYKNGVGSGSSRMLSGTFKPHVALEQLIAKFKKSPKALVFNSGYAANTGIIPVIAGDDSIIFSDELNHSSIIDGAKLSRAKIKIYRHRDLSHLDDLLKKSLKVRSVKRRIIVTDTVFSMDGDIAPLESINKLSRQYNALFMIDDAHGTGVLGKTGRGGMEHAGISGRDIVQMGTLSKAVGCFGAFAAGKKALIDILINGARSFIYSTALPPAMASASAMALHIIATSSSRPRKRLWSNRERLLNGLAELGYDTLGSETPIIPILTGNVKHTLHLSKYLYRNNIYAPAIRPPTVPEKRCRIRFSVTAAHMNDDIDNVIECLRKYK